jgi:hypothetical protein
MDHITHPKRLARPGTLWVCGACGKTARDRYGEEGSSWDESCMLNSWLCTEESVTYGATGRAVRVQGTIEQP